MFGNLNSPRSNLIYNMIMYLKKKKSFLFLGKLTSYVDDKYEGFLLWTCVYECLCVERKFFSTLIANIYISHTWSRTHYIQLPSQTFFSFHYQWNEKFISFVFHSRFPFPCTFTLSLFIVWKTYLVSVSRWTISRLKYRADIMLYRWHSPAIFLY